MRAGPLRNVVEIQRRDEEVTSTGGSSPDFVAVWSNVRASIEPLSAHELVSAKQAQMRVTHKITIRGPRAGLTSKHRIVEVRAGVTTVFNIESVIDSDRMHREIVLLAREAA